MNYPKVTIIILNWNGKEDTIGCLESLKHITYPNYEILLVDNGSKDGSVECFKEKYPELKIIENGENLGFAEGNNVGIRKAMDNGTDYVLLSFHFPRIKADGNGPMTALVLNNSLHSFIRDSLRHIFHLAPIP